MSDNDLRALLASLIEGQKRTDEQLAKTDAQLARTDAQLAKTDAQLAKTDAQLAKTDAQLAKTDAQLAKTDAQLAKTDARVKSIAELVGNISNNQGEMTEEFFFRSLEKNPTVGPLHFNAVSRHWKTRKAKVEDEFDIILLNGDSVGLVEVKSKAHFNEVDKLIGGKIPHFRLLFPDYAGYKIYPMLASQVTYPALEQRAAEAGVLLLTQRGEHLVLAQDQARAY
jgi:hypothetical protein